MFKSSFSGRKLFRGRARRAGDGCDRGYGEGGVDLSRIRMSGMLSPTSRGYRQGNRCRRSSELPAPGVSGDRQAASTAVCLPRVPEGNAFTGGTGPGWGEENKNNLIKSNEIAFELKQLLSAQDPVCAVKAHHAFAHAMLRNWAGTSTGLWGCPHQRSPSTGETGGGGAALELVLVPRFAPTGC